MGIAGHAPLSAVTRTIGAWSHQIRRRRAPTASPARRAPTCSSTRTTRSTGTRGVPRRSVGPCELDRPIFLSVGYAACHWCHVMERESFEDASTAAVLNAHFVADQGGPRGAPRHRRALHGRRPGDHRPGRLADERVPDPRGPAVLRGHLLPGRAAARDAVVPPGARGRARRLVRAAGRAGGGRQPPRVRAGGAAARGVGRVGPAAARGARRGAHRHRRGLRPGQRRLGPGPQVPAGDDHRGAAAAACGRRPGPGARDRPAQPGRDGGRRCPRPARRWLPPLLDRRALAGAALRADAVRQRPAGAGLRPCVGGHRGSGVPRDVQGRPRLPAARAADPGRRVCGQPGRRHRRRGRRHVRLDGRGDPRGRGRGRGAGLRGVRRHGRRELGGAHDPVPDPR